MINEKALVRLMKDAYGGGGLKVWRLDYDYKYGCAASDATDSLLITSGFWTALAPMERVPSKALATIVEWNRRLLYCGEALQLMKKTEPLVLEENARGESILETVPDRHRLNDCKLTKFIIEYKRVFQLQDLSFVTVSEELLELLADRRNMAQVSSDRNSLYWKDPDTDECVWLGLRRDVKQQDLARLKM